MQKWVKVHASAPIRRPVAVTEPVDVERKCALAEPRSFISKIAQRTYEQYVALARAEVQIGNMVGAENYQHAEHYFRLMSSDRKRT